ncbi:MAG: carboxylating nicotinate-nucleotide diphosphorylase [Candidatus Promineifilaceae bacterium]
MMTEEQIIELVQRAFREDIGSGDVTSALIPAEQILTATFVAKAEGVVAGLAVARVVFAQLDPTIVFTPFVEEGDRVGYREPIATVKGNARAVLTAERTALNFMQRMSGIATKTRRFMDEVAGTNAVILDTRKTVPGLRLIDKWAVRLGGGMNHRMGLYDMVLIKDNHIAAAGSITAAVEQVRVYLGERQVPIEVEVTDLDMLREALPLNVERIMLDNMPPALMAEAVRITNGATPLEASGNVKLDTLREIAETGVDYISSGALTHSVVAFDISLEAE